MKVHSFDLVDVFWFDWGLIFSVLGFGVGGIFQLISLTTNSGIVRKKLYTLTNFWLILSGVIHCWIEYCFVFSRSTSIIKPTMDTYAAADYRYGDYGGLMESGTTAMEAITALLTGPICLLVAFGATHNLSFRYPLQLTVCTMQLYGLLWFILQPIFTENGLQRHFSNNPILFWVVTVGCNAPWGIVPSILLIDSFVTICSKFM